MELNLFIHYRDLRLHDNSTLYEMSKEENGNIIPIFIFTNDQINPKKCIFFK